jgi:hypothetical protein
MTPQTNKLFPRILPVILLALSLVTAGCPTGIPEFPGAGFPGETAGSDENNENAGSDGNGTPQPDPAAALANTLNGSAGGNVSVAGNTVTVNRSLRVSSVVLSSLRAAGGEPGNVPSFVVPAGVTFVVPEGMAVTVLTGGTIRGALGSAVRIAGTITVNAGGFMETAPGSAVEVQGRGVLNGEPDSIVTVKGSLNAALGASVGNTVIVEGEITGEGARPLLNTIPDISYAPDGTVSVIFTFNETVEAQSPGAEVSGPGKTITVTPQNQIPGTAAAITLTARYPNGPGKTVFTETVMPAHGFFAPVPGSERTVTYYDAHGVVGLKNNGTTGWFFVKETDADWRKLFNAVYTPNAPGTADLVEQGKTATAYTQAISEKTLGLFVIAFGANYGTSKVFLKGEDLPNAGGANIIVIDLGLPAETPGLTGNPNDGLKFLIPNKGLGTAGGDYRHIWLRVNRGAELVIEADNRGYISGGAGHPAERGNFNRGYVEVMAGGRLRDGAYEGFPLGEDAVILSRLGSYLAVGPEGGSPDAAAKAQVYNDYYAGWLIGPNGNSARIEWGTGDQNGNNIEVREGKLAFSANVTVKKTLALMYNVWFVNEPTVTIDVKNDGVTIRGKPGLFAAGADYKFYGTASASGGQNVGSPKSTIIVKSGSTLHKAFLTSGDTDMAALISAEAGDIIITNRGTGGQIFYTHAGGISGYLNWNIP